MLQLLVREVADPRLVTDVIHRAPPSPPPSTPPPMAPEGQTAMFAALGAATGLSVLLSSVCWFTRKRWRPLLLHARPPPIVPSPSKRRVPPSPSPSKEEQQGWSSPTRAQNDDEVAAARLAGAQVAVMLVEKAAIAAVGPHGCESESLQAAEPQPLHVDAPPKPQGQQNRWKSARRANLVCALASPSRTAPVFEAIVSADVKSATPTAIEASACSHLERAGSASVDASNGGRMASSRLPKAVHDVRVTSRVLAAQQQRAKPAGQAPSLLPVDSPSRRSRTRVGPHQPTDPRNSTSPPSVAIQREQVRFLPQRPAPLGKRQRSAILIQKVYRGRSTRQRQAPILHQRQRSAILIQKMHRGRSTRQRQAPTLDGRRFERAGRASNGGRMASSRLSKAVHDVRVTSRVLAAQQQRAKPVRQAPSCTLTAQGLDTGGSPSFCPARPVTTQEAGAAQGSRSLQRAMRTSTLVRAAQEQRGFATPDRRVPSRVQAPSSVPNVHQASRYLEAASSNMAHRKKVQSASSAAQKHPLHGHRDGGQGSCATPSEGSTSPGALSSSIRPKRGSGQETAAPGKRTLTHAKLETLSSRSQVAVDALAGTRLAKPIGRNVNARRTRARSQRFQPLGRCSRNDGMFESRLARSFQPS